MVIVVAEQGSLEVEEEIKLEDLKAVEFMVLVIVIEEVIAFAMVIMVYLATVMTDAYLIKIKVFSYFICNLLRFFLIFIIKIIYYKMQNYFL
jgi:hypothetical protein